MTGAPCEVWFYHLERSGLDQVLPELLEKTLARGWRALVRPRDRDRAEHLDGWLWSYRDDSFLPHGTEAEPSAARQPVLIAVAPDNLNAANVLFLIDGAEAGDISSFERCILLFDGRDSEALAEARRRWSGFKSAGRPVSYWRQGETSGWRKEA
jgi:DNA polymerase-3 subunit chi